MRLLSALDRLSKIAGAISAMAILISVFVVAYDVSMRFVFNKPTPWGNEVSTYLLLIIGSFGVVNTLLQNRHIRADIVHSRLRPNTQVKANIITFTLSLLFCILGTWKSVQLVMQAYHGGWTHEPLYIVPVWLTYSIVAISFFLLSLESVSKLSRCFLKTAEAKNEPSKDIYYDVVD